jgi:hypothetical protein
MAILVNNDDNLLDNINLFDNINNVTSLLVKVATSYRVINQLRSLY